MDANWLPIAVLGFGIVVIFLETWKMTLGWGPQSIRIVGLTLVVVAALFLVLIMAVLKVPGELTAAAFGLLGTVAGYIFGRNGA